MKSVRIDMTGQQYGDWTVIRFLETVKKKTYWLAKCKCGVEQRVQGPNLRQGLSTCCVACGHKKTSRANVGIDRSKYPPEEKTLRRFMKEYMDRSREFNRPFELTFDQFRQLATSRCFYCGTVPSLEINRTNEAAELQIRQERYDAGWVKVNGIDRIDSDKGYTIENSTPCCNSCNKAKLDRTVADFSTWVDQIYNHKQKTGWSR